jgi:response regulator NasT
VANVTLPGKVQEPILARILIADDEGSVRKLLRILLESHKDWQVVAEAKDGQQAIEQAAQVSPDLVIVDLDMPVKDGLCAARAILQASPTLPILMYTAHNSPEIELHAREAGILRIVDKTDSGTELIGVIEELVSKPVAAEVHAAAGANCSFVPANM